MGKRMKSYLVFISFFYRIIMFVLMPVVLPGSFLWFRAVMGEEVSFMGDVGVVIIMMSFLSLIEILSDNWLFGGIQTKDTMKMNYLRASGRGLGIMRSALYIDMFRKFLSAVGITAIYYLASPFVGGGMAQGGFPDGDYSAWSGQNPGGNVWWIGILLFPALVSCFLSVLGTFLARFADMLWVNMLIGYGAFLLGVLSWNLPGVWEYIWSYNILFLFLGMISSVLAVKTAMRKMEGSYYD